MIGRLVGQVVHLGEDHAVIDVGGVGYVVHCSARTLGGLRMGEVATLHTDLLVREDLLQLYGFPTMMEREWHRLLTTVQGVGARVSVGILGALGPDGAARAIAMQDSAALRRAPGVGPKLAQRVVHELKNRAPAMMAAAGQAARAAAPAAPSGPQAPAEGPSGGPSGFAPAPETPDSDPAAAGDALSALVNLGYSHAEAAEAVARASHDAPEADAGALIKAALKALAPRG